MLEPHMPAVRRLLGHLFNMGSLQANTLSNLATDATNVALIRKAGAIGLLWLMSGNKSGTTPAMQEAACRALLKLGIDESDIWKQGLQMGRA